MSSHHTIPHVYYDAANTKYRTCKQYASVSRDRLDATTSPSRIRNHVFQLYNTIGPELEPSTDGGHCRSHMTCICNQSINYSIIFETQRPNTLVFRRAYRRGCRRLPHLDLAFGCSVAALFLDCLMSDS